MGIPKFTSFINNNDAFFDRRPFHLKGQQLVCDGGSLYWSLIRPDKLSFKYGGAYNRLYETFRKFFLRLKNLKVTPYVVLDGGSNSPLKDRITCKKMKTAIKRVNKLCENPAETSSDLPRPILVERLFIQVLRDMSISFVVTEGEADMLTGILSNRIGCPVVTQDSDFYIYDLKHGVVQLPSLLKSIWSKNPHCSLYRVHNLVKNLKIEIHKLPVIAVILGNDFSKPATLAMFQKYIWKDKYRSLPGIPSTMYDAVIGYLQKFASLEEIIQDLCSNALRSNISKQSAFIQITNELCEYNFSTIQEEQCLRLYNILTQTPIPESTEIQQELTLEETILRLVNNGHCFSAISDIFFDSVHFIPVQSENIKENQSFSVADSLCEYTYRLLLSHNSTDDEFPIKQFCRVDEEYISCSFILSKSGWLRPYLPIDVLYNKDGYSVIEKQKILCILCDLQIENLLSLESSEHVFVLAVRYWVKCCCIHPSDNHIKAMLISHIKCRFLQQKSSGSKYQGIKTRNSSVAHQFCSFQAILYYFIQLNELFMRPFEDLELRCSVNEQSPLAMLESQEEVDYYLKCWGLVTKGKSKKKSKKGSPPEHSQSDKGSSSDEEQEVLLEEVFEVPVEEVSEDEQLFCGDYRVVLERKSKRKKSRGEKIREHNEKKQKSKQKHQRDGDSEDW